MSSHIRRSLLLRFVRYLLFVALALSGGCGGKLYQVQPFDASAIRDRAAVQSENDLLVRAAIPDARESQIIFGVPLYEQGVQAVWLEIENGTNSQLRYAPVGTDLEYFSPLEIAYKNRSGLSDEGRLAIDKRFYELAMPRYIAPGETASGFILTHLHPGTKGFNVDLFGDQKNVRFTFFVTAPGFIPDHAEIDFAGLYDPDEIRRVEMDGLYDYLASQPINSTDAANEQTGSPLNTILIAKGEDILYALLRSGWRETARGDRSTVIGSGDYFFLDRRQDTIFRYEGSNADDGFYELRLWLSPAVVNDVPIWMGQMRHFVDHRWIDAVPDLDVDSAMWYMFQKLWYSETLLKFGWIMSGEAAPIDEPHTDFQGSTYFTSGIRVAMWLSGDPVSLQDIEFLDWDDPFNP